MAVKTVAKQPACLDYCKKRGGGACFGLLHPPGIPLPGATLPWGVHLGDDRREKFPEIFHDRNLSIIPLLLFVLYSKTIGRQ